MSELEANAMTYAAHTIIKDNTYFLISFSDDLLLEQIGTSLPISCVRNTLRVLARAKSCRRHLFELDRYTWDTDSELLVPLTRMLGAFGEVDGETCCTASPLAGLTLPDDDVEVADEM